LSHLNNEELKKHYLFNGIREKRIYKLPDNFETTIYRYLNNDLINLNDEDLINHYINHGINEERKYTMD
jgi:hypothetical protein